MLNTSLPINRDEKHYTAFLLSNIILNSIPLTIGKFFKFIGVPEEFLKENYSINDIEILVEYSLGKIKKNQEWRRVTKGKRLLVPDLIIYIKLNENKKFLIVIEGKVFSKVDSEGFRKQLNDQKSCISCISEIENLSTSNILHLGILLNKFENFELRHSEKIITWSDILEIFIEQKGLYAYEYLSKAVDEKNALTSLGRSTYRINCTNTWTIYEIIQYYQRGKEYSDFVVGSPHGFKNLKKQIYSGRISLQDKEFEVNIKSNSPFNYKWFHVRELIAFLNSYDGFDKVIDLYE